MDQIIQGSPSARFLVTVSVAGQPVAQHECADRAQASRLLTEVRELAEDLAYLLPDLTALGWELQTYE